MEEELACVNCTSHVESTGIELTLVSSPRGLQAMRAYYCPSCQKFYFKTYLFGQLATRIGEAMAKEKNDQATAAFEMQKAAWLEERNK
jgi:uncharacterized protein with PIN domain